MPRSASSFWQTLLASAVLWNRRHFSTAPGIRLCYGWLAPEVPFQQAGTDDPENCQHQGTKRATISKGRVSDTTQRGLLTETHYFLNFKYVLYEDVCLNTTAGGEEAVLPPRPLDSWSVSCSGASARPWGSSQCHVCWSTLLAPHHSYRVKHFGCKIHTVVGGVGQGFTDTESLMCPDPTTRSG